MQVDSSSKLEDRNATFGQRLGAGTASGTGSGAGSSKKGKAPARGGPRSTAADFLDDGDVDMEMSWTPSSNAPDSDTGTSKKKVGKAREMFGHGLERGADPEEEERQLKESDRKGRTQRRHGMRSGSKNTFRRL
jgi:ribosome biogenesis protein ENP2